METHGGAGLSLCAVREGTPWSLEIEDDGKVAYAYLLEDGEIVGDVWLYNRGAAPSTAEWSLKANLPFRNAEPYVLPGEFEPIRSAQEVRIHWPERAGKRCTAEIEIRGVRHAELSYGQAPGSCRLASRDGPCARVLPD